TGRIRGLRATYKNNAAIVQWRLAPPLTSGASLVVTERLVPRQADSHPRCIASPRARQRAWGTVHGDSPARTLNAPIGPTHVSRSRVAQRTRKPCEERGPLG